MHRLIETLARIMAVLGGIVLTALVALICLSVLGRSLNGVLHDVNDIAPSLSQLLLQTGVGPVNGDFELVESGIAFAIFAFLPICHLSGGHARVDVFTSRLPVNVNRFLTMITELVFAGVLIVIAWQLSDGMLSKKRYGETTFLLQFPIWWAYAASLFGAVIAALVGAYIAVARVIEFVAKREILPTEDTFE